MTCWIAGTCRALLGAHLGKRHGRPAVPRTRFAPMVWLALMLSALAIAPTSAGTLSSVSPSGATPGITLTILGSGFNTTAANNLVTFTPSAGAPVSG